MKKLSIYLIIFAFAVAYLESRYEVAQYKKINVNLNHAYDRIMKSCLKKEFGKE